MSLQAGVQPLQPSDHLMRKWPFFSRSLVGVLGISSLWFPRADDHFRASADVAHVAAVNLFKDGESDDATDCKENTLLRTASTKQTRSFSFSSITHIYFVPLTPPQRIIVSDPTPSISPLRHPYSQPKTTVAY